MEIAIIVFIFICAILVIWLLSRRAHLHDDARILDNIKRSAEGGDVYSQFILAGMYFEGKGIHQDDKEAAKWYSKAAENGHVEAQFILGIMYEKGNGITRDDTLAYKWFCKAAEQGHNRAKVMLESDSWKRFAEKQQCVESENNIENKKEHKVITDEELEKYRLKAQEGDVDAQYNLGVMFYHGEGVQQDYEEAIKWFHMAGEQDDADAQYNLGFMYGRGEGIGKNREQSMQWFKKAAEQGHAGAKEILEKMLRKKTS